MPRSAYGFSKLTGEVWCRAAHDEHGLPYTICRPFNAYGPGEMPEDEPGIAHMVPDVIQQVPGAGRGAPLPIFGDGTQTRTLTHVDDIADGDRHRDGLARRRCNEDFNISAGDELTVAEIARVDLGGLRRATPTRSRSSTCRAFEVDVVRRWPSVEKAQRLLGWEARIGVARASRRPSTGCARGSEAGARSPADVRAARRCSSVARMPSTSVVPAT